MKNRILGILGIGFFLSACGSSNLNYDKGVYRTKNQQDWDYMKVEERGKKKSAISDDIYKMVTNPKNKSEVYASGKNGLYKSTNMGSSWKSIDGELTNILDLTLDQSDDQSIYIVGVDGKGISKLKRSTNGGDDWETVYEHPVKEVLIRSVSINPINDDELLIGTSVGEIIKSEDFGESWRMTYLVEKKGSSVKFLSHNKRFPKIVTFFSNKSGFFISKDSGENFELIKDSLKALGAIKDIYTYATDRSTPGNYYLGGEEGLFFSSDYGENWRRVDTLITPGLAPVYGISINPKDSGNILVGTKNAILVSKDGGNTWTSVVFEDMKSGGFSAFTFCEEESDKNDLKECVVAGSNGSLSKGFL